ncbi:MAG: hypothetical protein ACTHU1_13280 [Arachnia sp.]
MSASVTTEAHRRLAHGPGCARPAPALRLSWLNEPEAQCPGCGRYAPAPDTRNTTETEETR